MTKWTVDAQGNHVFSAEEDAFRIRIITPAGGSRHQNWRTETWRSSQKWEQDFGYHYGSLEEARSDVADRYQHAVELRSLPSRQEETVSEKKRTPWGEADGKVVYGDGVVQYTTPGHGGFHLDRKRNAKVHPALRQACGDGAWYEEDCAWSVVAFTHGELFTSRERRIAIKTLKEYYPHPYTAATGEKVEPSESRTLREEEHGRRHANDWQAISAIYDDENPGMTRVTATLGGHRSTFNTTVEEKNFLVPNHEYAARSPELAFVIDPSRHREIDAIPGMPTP
ncbi:hypothetical protein ACVIGB_000061 [Bradyrhizobium sp. USDA 4341]